MPLFLKHLSQLPQEQTFFVMQQINVIKKEENIECRGMA